MSGLFPQYAHYNDDNGDGRWINVDRWYSCFGPYVFFWYLDNCLVKSGHRLWAGSPYPRHLLYLYLYLSQAMGGFPPPHITWWIGTRQLQPQQTVTQSLFVQCTSWEKSILFNSRPQKKEYQGVATSKLLYVPDITDDGHYLTCRSPRIISLRLKQKIFCQTIASTINITGC